MRVTLDILLEQIRTHLHVDAAALHLLDPHTQTLTCAAAHGFQSRAIQQVTLRTGEGYAGQVALGRRTMFLADLRTFEQNQFHLSWMYPDTFVSYCGVPLIARGQIKGVLEIFHRTRLDPEQDWFDFLEALSMQAAIAIDSVESFETLQRSNAQLVLAYEATIRGWAHALDLRDRETEGHSQRVTELTVQLARAAGLSDEQIAHIRRGALLHDIGKLGIPDSILLKPGSLTPEEWVIMRRHPEYAFGMLSPIIPAPGTRHPILPSRAMGWHRIPARSEGRSDTAGSASLCCCRCVGRASVRPSLSRALAPRTGAGVHPVAGGEAL